MTTLKFLKWRLKMVDKIDNVSVGQFYTEDYIKDSGLIRSVSWNRLYSTKLRSDKTSQDPDVKNNGQDDVSDVFEVTDIASTSASSNEIFSQMSVTNNESNTVSVTGTGTDTLVPPTGYVKITGFSQEVAIGGVTVVNDEFVIPSDGWYQGDGWATFRHSQNNSTVALVFGITPSGGSLVFSPRPTANKNPNLAELGNIAGGGIFYATAGTTLGVYCASDNTGDVTIPNASLRLWSMRQGSM